MKLPRGIAVIDAGKTNTKIALFSGSGKLLAERKVASQNQDGPPYRHLDPAPVIALCESALPELDAILPVDVIVPSGHGAAAACLAADGSLAVPLMDYTAEPPLDIVSEYAAIEPPFAEAGSPRLPMALTHGLQLYWQSRLLPEDFARVTTIIPWMQYVAVLLGGEPVTEVSAMSCQSHLVDVRTGEASSFIRHMGWQKLFPRRAKAWETIGSLNAQFRGTGFRGEGRILAGVHDSNGNYLRYMAAGLGKFTLLSTGTWIIGFDTEAKLGVLDETRDTVTNTNVFGNIVICCRFFGGHEFDVLSQHAAPETASLAVAEQLVANGTMALASFSDAGGPVPHSGNQGHIIGPAPQTEAERASLASLYCALMVSESLAAVGSQHDIIVDGPFSKNGVFLSLLASLRQGQRVLASDLRDGTTAGAACLAMMPDGKLPSLPLTLSPAMPAQIDDLSAYQHRWRELAYSSPHSPSPALSR